MTVGQRPAMFACLQQMQHVSALCFGVQECANAAPMLHFHVQGLLQCFIRLEGKAVELKNMLALLGLGFKHFAY